MIYCGLSPAPGDGDSCFLGKKGTCRWETVTFGNAAKHVRLALWEGSCFTIKGVGKLSLEEMKAKQHGVGERWMW